jgi:hypothetical protein
MHPLAVSWSIRSAVSKVLALLMLAGGALIPPDTVLCLGPSNHCHLEVVVGAGCTGQIKPHSAAPRLPDGCPRGSKDFRLRVDSHRTNDARVIAAPVAMMLLVASGLVALSHRPFSKSLTAGFPRDGESHLLSIVLRC